MIMDLPGAARALEPPAGGRITYRPSRLGIDQPGAAHCSLQIRQQSFDPVLGKRWIEKDEVKGWFAAAPEGVECALRLALDQFDLPACREPGHRIGDASACSAIALHHHHPASAARGRLQSQRAGACKQVQAAPAIERLAKPVEEGFAHPIRRGPKPRDRRHIKRSALPLPADDADPSWRRRWPARGTLAGARCRRSSRTRGHDRWAQRADAPAGGAPTTTVTIASGRIWRWKAARTSSSVTAATRSVQRSSQSSGRP